MKDHTPPTDRPVPAGSELNRWVATLVEELGVDPDAIDIDLLLDLARDVAHGVARPAVPLTSFVVGYVVGAGSADGPGGRDRLERAIARVTEMALTWDEGRSAEDGPA